MKKSIFEGSAVAIATPFKNNKVNLQELKRLIEFQINNSTDAIVVCGTTGESSTMSEDEILETIKFTVDTVNGRVPVIAGTGSNCTNTAIRRTKFAEKVGADAVLIVTPYYNKTSQKGLIEHYKDIANSTNIPIILYNVPSRTGVNINPETVYKLSKEKNIVGIKEASGNISQIATISSLVNDDFAIYSGNDDQIVPILSLGGKGVISVLANIFPQETHDIVESYLCNDVVKAKDLQLKYLNLIHLLFSDVNPIPVKDALSTLGFDYQELRKPLINISEEKHIAIEHEIKKLQKK